MEIGHYTEKLDMGNFKISEEHYKNIIFRLQT